MVTPIIPCKRPKVVVGHESLLNWYTKCHVTGCDWLYGMTSSKTDAEENARRHRAAHRNAVPSVMEIEIDGRRADRCTSCGWVTPAGFSTRDDRARTLANHLADQHQVVTA